MLILLLSCSPHPPLKKERYFPSPYKIPKKKIYSEEEKELSIEIVLLSNRVKVMEETAKENAVIISDLQEKSNKLEETIGSLRSEMHFMEISLKGDISNLQPMGAPPSDEPLEGFLAEPEETTTEQEVKII